jgi:hypothetical protein
MWGAVNGFHPGEYLTRGRAPEVWIPPEQTLGAWRVRRAASVAGKTPDVPGVARPAGRFGRGKNAGRAGRGASGGPLWPREKMLDATGAGGVTCPNNRPPAGRL